jgi:acyl carrier protein
MGLPTLLNKKLKQKNETGDKTMLEKITQILRDYKDDQDLEVTEESTFVDMEFDSLDTVELVMNIEEEYGVSIEMDESIKTVGDLIKVIEENNG